MKAIEIVAQQFGPSNGPVASPQNENEARKLSKLTGGLRVRLKMREERILSAVRPMGAFSNRH
ncbi:MAG: hypothetical protein P0Y59_21940 [Candidatus Sphingomonas phytovorans]|nr:hypothetical protein [Sphingomonas sp.]WEJ99536.1 MAG: hypothetical protein P0Y59_21940 [Sphingomonas sp.]